MRSTVISMFAAIALIVAADANAHLMTTHRCNTLSCINARQLQNLKHARYVCNNGAHQTKRWNCAAVKWLTREYNETEAVLHPAVPSDLGAWMCIHHYEGAWNANTGNGYHGGLQMDWGFMNTYGAEYVHRWGGAENWPPYVQIEVARRARDSGRGYGPWPKTARMCGLL